MSEHQGRGSIRHLRTRKELEPKLYPATASGIVIENGNVSLSLLTFLEVFAWRSFFPVSKVVNWQSFLIKKVFL